MPARSTIRARFESLSLALSALLLAVFPLIRPFFPLDPRAPAETLAAASPAIASTPWVVSHLLCTLAFILLLYGMLSLAGIALVLPMLGVETYMLPILGRLYLAGQAGVAPAIGMIYLGPALFV